MPEPEKIPLAIENLYSKAKDAFDNNQFDYCQTLLDTILDTTRHHAHARMLRRIVQLKMYDAITHVKFSLWIKRILSYCRVLRPIYYTQKKMWTNAIDQWENILAGDPKNLFALHGLAKAAQALDWTQTSADTYEIIKKIDPNNMKAITALAKLHFKEGNLEKSRKNYEHIVRSKPLDADADRGLKDIAAISMIEHGVWEDSSSYRDKILNEVEADRYEREARLVKSTDDINILIQDLEKKISATPDNISFLKILGDLHFQLNQFDQSVEYFEKALSLTPSDGIISEQIGMVREKKIDYEIAAYQSKLKEDPDNAQIIETLKELEKSKQRTRLQDCLDRVKRYPNNNNYRFELGQIYFHLEQYNDSIHQFQQSVKDPKLRNKSLYFLGRNFQESGFPDLAEKQYEKVLQDLYDMDDFKKQVVYHLGLVYELSNRNDKAIVEFKKIFEVDIDYKDVSQKIRHYHNKT
ncbi:MAG: tetratricopeptide repeat protein [Chlamydiota bacterium]|nr:tetratricopeptide repeat protein [Chlamydiota bacterium]